MTRVRPILRDELARELQLDEPDIDVFVGGTVTPAIAHGFELLVDDQIVAEVRFGYPSGTLQINPDTPAELLAAATSMEA